MTLRRLLGLLAAVAAALLSVGALAQGSARQTAASFTVSVRLFQSAPGSGGGTPSGSGTCGSTTSQSVISVGCANGASAAPLQVMAVKRDGMTANFDIYTGGGTITGWRVVSFDDRDYLEMTLGW